MDSKEEKKKFPSQQLNKKSKHLQKKDLKNFVNSDPNCFLPFEKKNKKKIKKTNKNKKQKRKDKETFSQVCETPNRPKKAQI